MLRIYHWYWRRLFQLLDIGVLVVAWQLTAVLQNGRLTLFDDGWWHAVLVLALVWWFVSQCFNLYRSKRLAALHEDVAELTVIVLLVMAILLALHGFGLLQMALPPTFLGLAWGGIVLFHIVVRLALRDMRRLGRNQRRVLIYGAGEIGQRTARALIERPYTGMRVVGFLDDDPQRQRRLIFGEVPVIGSSHDARQLIGVWVIQEVIIALPASQYDRLRAFVAEIGALPVNVRVVPDLLDIISVSARGAAVGDIPLIGVRQPTIAGSAAIVKRTVDVLLAAIGLLLALPLLGVAAVLIKRHDGGPVLFKQQRVGLNGCSFTLYKLRTMVIDAEQRLSELVDLDRLPQPAYKIRDDPRITPIGRLLRRTSIDELPQLVNVLRGDMSLVGPRPEQVCVVDRYSPQQRNRLLVKPGLTGPMQTSGRGDLPFDERLQLELSYIEDYSLFRDVILIVKTVPAVLLGRGAH